MVFKYKRLPNLCFWCGRLSHGDRDCPLWLQSKGTLKEEDQQFGPSLRATPYNPTNQRVIYVPGFYDKLGLKEDEVPRRKESGATVQVRWSET